VQVELTKGEDSFDPKFKHCQELLESRYLAFKFDENGKKRIVETPKLMFHRVAEFLAKNEREYENFFNVISNLDALPNSPTLWGAGHHNRKTLLSACAMLEVQDSTEDILDQLKQGALLQKFGSGVGFYLGNIRGKTSVVSSSGGVALGPVAVMRAYNAMFREISQGGRRRGAFIGIVPVWHCDILEFIESKNNPEELNMFNISVAFTDEFFKVLNKEEEFQLFNPQNGKLIPAKKIEASKIWEKFTKASHHNGEPGAIYLDTIQKHYPSVWGTNPCSEALLEHKEFCNLGSINLMNHVVNLNGGYEIDWEKLRITVKTMVFMLNRVIDNNFYPDQEYERQVQKNRKIGLGIMGFADILNYFFKYPYDSEKARSLAKKIMRYIREQAKRYSERKGFHNQSLTSIAPTGSIATICGVSSGIEPIFSKSYTRTTYEGFKYDFDVALEGNWIQTAHEISPENHVRMVGAVAKSVDLGISKTVNFEEDVLPEEIGKMFKLAWELGLTGLTCYRNNSRQGQPLIAKKNCEDGHCEVEYVTP